MAKKAPAPKRIPKVLARAPEPPPVPYVGDRVIPDRTESTYVITRVSPDGDEVDISLPGTNLERFRVKTAQLKFVDRVAQSSRPSAKARPALNASEVNERIVAVQRENLQRLDDDIDILMKYLRGEDAPKAVIDALEALRSEQQEGWKTAVERISKLLDE